MSDHRSFTGGAVPPLPGWAIARPGCWNVCTKALAGRRGRVRVPAAAPLAVVIDSLRAEQAGFATGLLERAGPGLHLIITARGRRSLVFWAAKEPLFQPVQLPPRPKPALPAQGRDHQRRRFQPRREPQSTSALMTCGTLRRVLVPE